MYYSKQHRHKKQINSIYKFSIIVGILILVLAWPFSFILPVSMSFENGLIENLQVLILVLGSIYNIKLIWKSIDKQVAYFHIWCAVFMLFMAFRELSWGRVFYQIDMESSGPVFIAMSDYPWKIEVHIIIIICILFLIIFMLRNLPIMRMLHCRFPILIIFSMLVAMVFSYIGDHGMLVGKLQGQIIEEMGELAFYVLTCALCIYYHMEL